MMRRSRLAAPAVWAAVLSMSAPAPAEFIGLEVESKPNPFGLFVCNVYAVFDNSSDQLIAVFSFKGVPMTVDVINGTFHQDVFGGDVPPSCSLLDIFPCLAFDSFVTIGLKCDDGTDVITLVPGFGFSASTMPLLPEDSAWFVTPDDAQSFPDAGRVLLGQFSTADGDGFTGLINILVLDPDSREIQGLTFTCGGVCGDTFCNTPAEDQCNCPEDCGTPPSSEMTCSDGFDNDCDGCTDAADSDCGAAETTCTDGSDNDCDGLIDCDDPDCDCAPKFGQPLSGAGEAVASNIDWTDDAPNTVVADDFISDGRTVNKVRWWGGPLLNGSFETGDFTGWTTANNGLGVFCPWTVSGAPGGCWVSFPTSPLSGAFDAWNGFDGQAGLIQEMYRDVTLPSIAPITLTTNHRIQYDSLGIPSTLPREFDITIRNTSNWVLSPLYHQDVVINGAPPTDLGWNNQVFDISAFAGQTVRIHFEVFIPENSTGPGTIEFDDISIDCPTKASGVAASGGPREEPKGATAVLLTPPTARDSAEEMRADYHALREQALETGENHVVRRDRRDAPAPAASTRTQAAKSWVGAGQQIAPPAPGDGWFISFHEPLADIALLVEPALGLYYCDNEVVSQACAGRGCDGELVIRYDVDLADCCLVHSEPDTRTGAFPAQPYVFEEERCFEYAIGIQAVRGHAFEDDGTGVCLTTAVSTGQTADGPFWGWETTEIARSHPLLSLGPALQTRTQMDEGDWVYGPWGALTLTCSQPNMAFALFTDEVRVIPDDDNDGIPDACTLCEPTTDGLGCGDPVCPARIDRCVPQKVSCEGGPCRVIECKCQDPDVCHVELVPQNGGTKVSCTGGCSPLTYCARLPIDTDNNGSRDGFECVCRNKPNPIQLPSVKRASRSLGIGHQDDTVGVVAGIPIPNEAIRVKLVQLYDESVCPPRTTEPNLSLFNGEVRWLGPPADFDDNSLLDPKFIASELRCNPTFREWTPTALGIDFPDADPSVVHGYGAAVVPCSTFEVQVVEEFCADLNDETCYSEAVQVTTALWGDLWKDFEDVNFTDIGKMVEAFKSIVYVPAMGKTEEDGAPPKIRAMLRDNVPPYSTNINFTDIGAVVDAFKTIAYKELGPAAEICDDGIDNNCDGAIDGNFEPCAGPTGIGLCGQGVCTVP